MELSDILDTPSPLIRVNACMYEYMPHMYIFVTALSNIPLIMLCMFPHGLYSLLDYEINLSYLIFEKGAHKKPLITHLPFSITIKRLLIIIYDTFDDFCSSIQKRCKINTCLAWHVSIKFGCLYG